MDTVIKDISIEGEAHLSLSIVTMGFGPHPDEDALLQKFQMQFALDNKEQMPEFETVFCLPVESTVHDIYRVGKQLFFIQKDQQIIGFVTVIVGCWPINNCISISEFFIDKPYRGVGYGRRVLNTIIKKLFEHYPSSKRIGLVVLSDNHVARSLYSSVGFNNKMETMILERKT